MSERLTDSTIAALFQWSESVLAGAHAGDLPRVASIVADAIAELRSRRAADLDDADREALMSLRATIEITGDYGSRVNRALTALDKILGGKEQKP